MAPVPPEYTAQRALGFRHWALPSHRTNLKPKYSSAEVPGPLTPGFSRGWQVGWTTYSPVYGAYLRHLGLLKGPWPLPLTVVNDGIGLCFRLIPPAKAGG